MLAASGLIVAIASNFDDRLLEITRQIEPLDRAERLYLSATIGHRKPAVEFFRFIERDLALRQANSFSSATIRKTIIEGRKLLAGRRFFWIEMGIPARRREILSFRRCQSFLTGSANCRSRID